MLRYIIVAIISMLIGFKWGCSTRLKIFDDKKKEIANLITELKLKNNEMLSNYSKIAHVTSDTEGQWTEVDDFIMPMWME